MYRRKTKKLRRGHRKTNLNSNKPPLSQHTYLLNTSTCTQN